MGKLFRVFFSSTFSDFVEERNALQKKVFPKLKEFCATHGARFQPIDLRWGIPDEGALQQSTMQICLDEIKRCQKHTPRPNFLVFLGERYGWTPPPVKIPKTEYERLIPHSSPDEKTMIEKWYKHDENELMRLESGELTTVYELQPRGVEFEKYEKWGPIETKLRSILLQAAKKANLSETEMIKYYASATHQEIIEGVLKVEGVNTHGHCFFRTITGLNEEESGKLKDRNQESIKNLSALRENLRKHLSSTIHDYKVNFGNNREKEEYIQKFCEDVHTSLESTIQQELLSIEKVSALEEEIRAHIEFAKDLTEVFVGREDIIQEIVDYIGNDSRIPFVVYGKSGSGKSALIAKIFERLQKEDLDMEVILRFLGTSTFSSDSIALLISVCAQIVDKFEIKREEETPFEYNKLQTYFLEILNSIQGDKKAVLLIDALDQLSKGDKGRDLEWLPLNLPEKVKIIISFATDDSEIENIVRKKLPDSLHELKALTPKNGDQLLDLLLDKALRRLTSEQREVVLNNFYDNGLPLYLKLAFEEARYWNSYDNVERLFLASDIDGVIQDLLKHLYIKHTKEVVDRILCYITAARNGLTEDEILEIMSSDSEFFDWYKNGLHHDLPEEKLPWIVWSRFYTDIEPFLTERGVDNTSTITFFHRQFIKYVEKNLFSESHRKRIKILAQYFQSQENFYGKNKIIPNYRKASEINFLLYKAEMWEDLVSNLTNLESIDLKCKAALIDDLINDFYLQKENENEKLKEFQLFVLKQAHILKKNAKIFPQLIGQQALNQLETSNVFIAGKKYLESFINPLPVLELRNKSQVNANSDLSILTLMGHSRRVNYCSFSPDGLTILSGSMDGTIKLWNTNTGAEIRTFKGHSESINACEFSNDGTRILSASDDKTLKLWDVDTGTTIHTFTGHSESVNACAFSPDGCTILSASGYFIADEVLSSPFLPKFRQFLSKHSEYSEVEDLMFSADGINIHSSSDHDNTLKLWDIETGKVIRTFFGHLEAVNTCVFSPDDNKIVSGSIDKMLKLWDLTTGEEIRNYVGHEDTINCCAFSPDGLRLISGSRDKTIKLWNVETGEEIHTLTGHFGSVNSCVFSPDGTQILSASNDDTLKLWNGTTGEEIYTLKGHANSVVCCMFSPNGDKILSGSHDNTLKLWDTQIVEEIIPYLGHKDMIYCCVFSPDGRKILTGSADQTLKLWDAENGNLVRNFVGHTEIVSCCAFSPDGYTILSGSWDGTLKLWDIQTGKEIRTFIGHSDDIGSCSFSPDGNKILSGSHDNTMKQWNAHTGQEIRTFKGHSKGVVSCSFSTDGNNILSGSWDKTIKLWNAKMGEVIHTFIGHIGPVESCKISPDGCTILSGSSDKILIQWDIKTGEIIRIFIGHEHTVNCCAFSPDGNTILSGSVDQTLRLWDVATGQSILFFPTIGSINCVSMNNDGLIAVGDSYSNLYILKLYSY